GFLGRVGDDKEGAAGGDEAWQHGESGRTGGAVQWLDGVDLDGEVEGALPRGGGGSAGAQGGGGRGARGGGAGAGTSGGGRGRRWKPRLGTNSASSPKPQPTTRAVRPVPRSERALAHCTRCGLGARLAQGIVASPRAAAW